MAAEDIDLQLFMSLADEAGGPADGEGPAAQLEEDDIFLQLAEAADAEGEVADEGGSGGNSPPGGGSQRAATSSGGGPRLSWVAKAAAVGSAGAVPPGYQPRQAVLLPPGAIPRSAAAPALLLPGQQPGGGGGGGRVAIFGAAPKGGAASGAGAGGAAAGSFTDVGQGSLVERYAGLKIKNPRVSHTQMRGRLADTSVLRLSQVRQRHRTAGLEGSWTTICVIGEKSKPRETAAGRAYSIWKVTDLDQTSISLFLFSDAHGDLWREAEGTILALFTPKVKTEGDFSLSVDSSDQVWVLGQSPEFGYCKATKKNGDPCRMPVNATRCPFCPFHVQSEYNKMKPTGRNEFQTSNLKTAFRPGMQRGLQWTPGQFDSAAAKQQRMRAVGATKLEGVAANARDRGSAAGARYLNTVANPAAAAAAEAAQQQRLTPAAAIAAAEQKGPAAAALAAAPIPAARPRGMLVLQQHKQQPQQGKRKAGAAPPQGEAGGSKRRASGGGGGSIAMIELDGDDEDVPPAADGTGGYDATAAARQRAVELLRAAGGASAPDPNATRRAPDITRAEVERLKAARAAAAGAAAAAAAGAANGHATSAAAATAAAGGSRRPVLGQSQAHHRPPPVPSVVSGGAGAPRLAAGKPPPSAAGAAAAAGVARSRLGVGGSSSRPAAPPAPKSAMEAAFSGVLADAAVTAAAAKGTRYKELVDDEEHEKLDRVMGALEARDEMATRMDGITRLAVQAFRCKVCAYTAERRRPECAAHAYAVERVEATKRWWQCTGCKYRFATVGQKYPAKRCVKCNQLGGEFKAVSMARPHKEHAVQREQSAVASRELLATRGVEQAWANSW